MLTMRHPYPCTCLMRQINLKADHEATVQFCFQDSASGADAPLESFSFVFHDFDNAKTELRERLRVGSAC